MAILDLIDLMRTFLQHKIVEELPAFGMPLPELWAHPDVLFNLFSNRERATFYLQPWVSNDDGYEALEEPAHPYLVAVLQPFQEHHWALLADLLMAAGRPYALDASQISVYGVEFRPGVVAERGTAWRITISDCVIGEALLLTKIFGCDFSQPVFVWFIDLVRLSDMVDNCDSATPPRWLSDPWAALRLWPVESPFPNLDPVPTWKILRERLEETAKPGILWQEAFRAGAQAARCIEKTVALGRQWDEFADCCRQELVEFWQARAFQWGILPAEPGKPHEQSDSRRGKGIR